MRVWLLMLPIDALSKFIFRRTLPFGVLKAACNFSVMLNSRHATVSAPMHERPRGTMMVIDIALLGSEELIMDMDKYEAYDR